MTVCIQGNQFVLGGLCILRLQLNQDIRKWDQFILKSSVQRPGPCDYTSACVYPLGG